MRGSSKFWFKNEKQLMRSLGLNPIPGSGNGIVKEDGQNDYILAQLKSTDKSSATIKLQDITQLTYHAEIAHKAPLFITQFIGGPVLLMMKLEDIDIIHEFITTGKAEARSSEVMSCEPAIGGAQRCKISAGNTHKLRDRMAKDRETKTAQMIQEMKERRKR